MYPAGWPRFFYLHDNQPLPGEYKVDATVAGVAQRGYFVLDGTTGMLAPAEDIRIYHPMPGADLAASWKPPASARSYITRIWDDGLDHVAVVGRASRTPTIAFPAPELPGPGPHMLEVLAFANDMVETDPPLPERFDVSLRRLPAANNLDLRLAGTYLGTKTDLQDGTRSPAALVVAFSGTSLEVSLHDVDETTGALRSRRGPMIVDLDSDGRSFRTPPDAFDLVEGSFAGASVSARWIDDESDLPPSGGGYQIQGVRQ